ncbi:hypothetical protein YB2330_002364 [Saitoella coloradoensis]
MSAPFISNTAKSYAKDFLSFVASSPTPFHAVASSIALLERAGFTELRERDSWASSIKQGGKYYVTRNTTSLIAFSVGKKWSPGKGVAMVGAHTDSPTLRLKPVSAKTAEGYLQVGVECYGGGIWHSWFDRDLGVAGRVMVKQGDGSYKQQLLKIDRPILRIPTLAIHLDRDVNVKFEFNKETHLTPIAGLVSAQLNAETPVEPTTDSDDKDAGSVAKRHTPALISLISNELSCKPEEIHDFELVLFDTQAPALGGLHEEFIFSARLDNLGCSYCAVRGISDAAEKGEHDDGIIRLISLFDHEEIGSLTAQGADSNFLPVVLERLNKLAIGDGAQATSTSYEECLAKSFLVSADMAHAVHPNYAAKYEPNHKPQLNLGPVIKINANARYATNSPGTTLLQHISSIPLQQFVVRNDSACGSTIGPMLSAKLGVRTVDLGNPQLSMHSIRECGGTKDVLLGTNLFREFFEGFEEAEAKIFVE